MKKITAVILCIAALLAFAACDSNKTTQEPLTGEKIDGNEAFEDMTGAALDGDFDEALELYKNGAADSQDASLNDWYFYSLAMQEYTENGCVGYPLHIIRNNCPDFPYARETESEILLKTRLFDGAYEYQGAFLYIQDGKVAFSLGEQLSGTVFCSYELAFKDDKVYIAERKTDGTHDFPMYIESDDNGLRVSMVNEDDADLYSGMYVPCSAEYPVLVF